GHAPDDRFVRTHARPFHPGRRRLGLPRTRDIQPRPAHRTAFGHIPDRRTRGRGRGVLVTVERGHHPVVVVPVPTLTLSCGRTRAVVRRTVDPRFHTGHQGITDAFRRHPAGRGVTGGDPLGAHSFLSTHARGDLTGRDGDRAGHTRFGVLVHPHIQVVGGVLSLGHLRKHARTASALRRAAPIPVSGEHRDDAPRTTPVGDGLHPRWEGEVDDYLLVGVLADVAHVQDHDPVTARQKCFH